MFCMCLITLLVTLLLTCVLHCRFHEALYVDIDRV